MKTKNNYILQKDDYSCGPIAFINYLTSISGQDNNLLLHFLLKKMRTSNEKGSEGTTSEDFIKAIADSFPLVCFKKHIVHNLPYSFMLEYKTGKDDFHFVAVVRNETGWDIINHWTGSKFVLKKNVSTRALKKILEKEDSFCYVLLDGVINDK